MVPFKGSFQLFDEHPRPSFFIWETLPSGKTAVGIFEVYSVRPALKTEMLTPEKKKTVSSSEGVDPYYIVDLGVES